MGIEKRFEEIHTRNVLYESRETKFEFNLLNINSKEGPFTNKSCILSYKIGMYLLQHDE